MSRWIYFSPSFPAWFAPFPIVCTGSQIYHMLYIPSYPLFHYYDINHIIQYIHIAIWEPIVNASLRIMKGHLYAFIFQHPRLQNLASRLMGDWFAIETNICCIRINYCKRRNQYDIYGMIIMYIVVFQTYVIFGSVWKLCSIVIADSTEESEQQSSRGNKSSQINSIFKKCRWNPRLVRGWSAIVKPTE
jgi:hypothetical protein